jgi:hypothetical protein
MWDHKSYKLLFIVCSILLGTFLLLNKTKHKISNNVTIIQVVIPHYKNQANLKRCLESLQMRQSYSPFVIVKYSIFTQEVDRAERVEVRNRFQKEGIRYQPRIFPEFSRVIDFPQAEKVKTWILCNN